MEFIVGIDLGTTNSVVAYTDQNGMTTTIAGKEGSRIVPSCVYFPAGDEPVVGDQARQYTVVDPERVARLFKRGMGQRTFLDSGAEFTVDGRTWSPEELSSMVLKKLVQMAEHHLGEPVTQAVITVPAYFGEPERAATKTAGELVGLEVPRIINEPTAAALAHGLEQEVRGRVLVFDLGGGTFDVTVMEVGADKSTTVIATGGDRRLGGIDFDRRILEKMVDQVARETGTDLNGDPWALADASAKAEEIKRELSRSLRAKRPVAAGGRPVMFELSREEFEQFLDDERQQVEDTIVSTMEQAAVQPGDLAGVLMVGGSSRIPMFQELLRKLTGCTPRLSRNLDEDVARGAAILGVTLDGDLDPRSELAKLPPPVDVASHGLGTTTWRETDDGQAVPDRNIVLIPAGTQLPAKAETTLGTLFDQQAAVLINLNEGDDTDLDYVRELDKTSGQFERPVPKGHPVRYAIEYTADQLIKVKAYDGISSGFLCELEVQHAGLLDEGERAEARSYLQALQLD